MLSFNANDYLYTPRFCEENIWHLGKSLMEEGLDMTKLKVWILSNALRLMPLFNQKACEDFDNPVFWDYHVILLYSDSERSEEYIFDFDTLLPFPSFKDEYLMKSLPNPNTLPKEYWISIREIPFYEYYSCFFSDRSHMLDRKSNPIVPFPPWAPILAHTSETKFSLNDYLNLNKISPSGSRFQPYIAFLLKEY